MIGYYNYSQYLTYMSALSAGLGILVSLNGTGHPYMGVFFLMFCGLCDAFDGKVARLKKDRTDRENKFGIQVDSLSDIIAFGVLPACIGDAMIRVSPNIREIPRFRKDEKFTFSVVLIMFVVLSFNLQRYCKPSTKTRFFFKNNVSLLIKNGKKRYRLPR